MRLELPRFHLLIPILLVLCVASFGCTKEGGADTAGGGDGPTGTTTVEGIPHGRGEPVEVPPGDYELVGDPAALKGGTFVQWTNSYPTHFNYYGPERNARLSRIYAEAMFNTLISVHLNTLEVIPEIASSWEENDGGKELIFKLDPDARWSDGKPITSKDVIATFDLMRHPKVVEIVLKTEFQDFERPEAIDDYTVRFRVSVSSWRNLLKFEDFYIYPAHAIDPETYLEQWRMAAPVVSGAYTLGEMQTGKFFKLERRKDFWGEKKRQFIGTYNFDTLYFKFIRDADLAFEATKKGDVDFYLISRAQRWAEEMEFERVKSGWIKKTKMWNKMPGVPSQWAFNLAHPVFKDVRVRKAMFHLLNREYLHDQIFYNQYVSKNSYYQNTIYENPENEKYTFDPNKGVALLQEAGWKEKDAEGVLVKDGRRLEFDFQYIHAAAERVYTPLQESYRKYGIKMNLKLISPSAWLKVSEKKDFEVMYINWGAIPFPNPRLLWHSEEADKDNSNNITRFKNERVDELIELYEKEWDLEKRAKLIQELDGILAAEVPYLLDWDAPYFRFMWWDKFGMPEWGSYASRDIRQTHWKTWWYQPERAERLEQARADGSTIERWPAENTHWK